MATYSEDGKRNLRNLLRFSLFIKQADIGLKYVTSEQLSAFSSNTKEMKHFDSQESLSHLVQLRRTFDFKINYDLIGFHDWVKQREGL